MLDRVLSKYGIRTQTNKWTIRTIFHFFYFCLAAAWLEYRNHALHPNSGLQKKDVLDYFQFRLDVAENLIHKRGTTDDSASDDETEVQVGKRRRTVPIPHEAARKECAMHLPENLAKMQKNRSKCRRPGCKALTFVRYSTCKVFLCFNNDRNCYMAFHK